MARRCLAAPAVILACATVLGCARSSRAGPSALPAGALPRGAIVVSRVQANLDGDPEAEVVVAYRECPPPGAPSTMVTRLAAFDRHGGRYMRTSDVECLFDHSVPLRVQDLQHDGRPEIIIRGCNGRFPGLGLYALRGGELRTLGWFEGYKVDQLLADLEGDGAYEVLGGTHHVVRTDYPDRQPRHPGYGAADWELWRWQAKRGAYEAVPRQTAAPLLRRGMRHADPMVRRACVQALGWLADERTVPALTRALSDTDAEVRRAAVWALAKTGAGSSVPALRRAAESDAYERVRSLAREVVDGTFGGE